MIFLIECPVWNTDIIINLGSSSQQVRKFINKRWEIEDEELLDTYTQQLPKGKSGSVLVPENGPAMIKLNNDVPYEIFVGTIAHEIAHCAIRILRRAGIVFCEKSEEAYTYLIGYITRELYSKLV